MVILLRFFENHEHDGMINAFINNSKGVYESI